MSVVHIDGTTATRIRKQIELAELGLQTSFEHYLTAGQLLADQKATLPHGEWLPWLEHELGIPERDAQRYMRLAEHRDAIEANPTRLSDLSMTAALSQIAKPRATPPPREDVSAQLRALAGNSEPSSDRDEPAEDRPSRSVTWSEQQQRKRHRAIDQLEHARTKLDDASGGQLSAFSVADQVRDAAIQARHAAATLDDLAFTFEP